MSYHRKQSPVLAPEDQRRELAAIFARGLVGFFCSCAMEQESAPFTASGGDPETVQKALDVSPESDPVVSRYTQQRI
jgi:hypothetical protein